MKTYQYFLLDWDGNLARTLDLWLRAARTILEMQGFDFSDEEIAGSFGSFTASFANWGVKDVEGTIDEIDALAKQGLPEVALYPDALEVLEKLNAQGKQIALITTSYRNNVEPVLERHNLTHFFDVIVSGDDVQHKKPHPEPLEKALHALNGLKHKELAVMVGDTDKDIQAAKNAGVDSVLFYPPEHRKFYALDNLKQHEPTYIIHDFRELLNAA